MIDKTGLYWTDGPYAVFYKEMLLKTIFTKKKFNLSLNKM